MPPRKSNASAAGTAAAASTPASPTTTTGAPGDTSILSTTEPKSPTTKKQSRQSQQQDDVGIDELLLPRSLTSRIARGMLPPNTSLQKDAVLALTKSATVFISYLAATANEQRPSAKTVTPQDVLKALREMELDRVMGLGERNEDGSVGGRLERELAVFEEVVRGKRKGYREKVKARESGVGAEGEGGDGDGDGEGAGGEGERDAKRPRRESEADVDADEEQDDEDALLDAQLNGPNGGLDEHEEDHEDEDEGEDPEEDEPDEEEEMEDSIDVDDGPGSGRRGRAGSRGRSSILSPNGRAEVGSDGDESD